MPKKFTTEDFIRKSKEVHGDRYIYDKSEYVNNRTQIIIICKEHGEFKQGSDRHMHGSNCPECNRQNKIKAFDEKKARKIHGDKYDYSKVEYKGFKDKVIIICPDHGEFQITPHSHIQGKQGCYACGKGIMTQEMFVKRIKDIHGDKYGTEKINYTNTRSKIILICPIHGEFEIRASHALDGRGCKKCSFDARKPDFITEATKIHDGKYDYSKSVYIGANELVTIICPHHGEFEQLAVSHLLGFGCGRCSCGKSGAEEELYNYVKSFCDDALRGKTRILESRKQLDIYIPSKKLAIEYCGLYWHSDAHMHISRAKSHILDKHLECEKQGIRLITVFEDEWLEKKDIVKNTIKHFLGKSEKGCYARNTTIKEIPWSEAKLFLDKYHLLGSGTPGKHRIGAYSPNGDIIGVMTFGTPSDERGSSSSVEMKRFVTDSKNHPGLGSKMFKYAVGLYGFNEVIAFVDRRWFVGTFKSITGFEKTNQTAPSLFWVRQKKRFKRRFMSKIQLQKMPQFNGRDLSKRAMMKELGYDRIWDCGKLHLTWKKESP